MKGASFDDVLSEWGLVLPCGIARQRDLRYHEWEDLIGARSLRIKFRITADCLPAVLAQLASQRHKTGRGDDPDFPFTGGVGPHGWRFDSTVTYSWYANDDTSNLRTLVIDERTDPPTAYLSIWIE
jgi:hypothetical protein